jgi:hypothetical protein
MGEIKSAWEIAQAKASKIGELSQEEREKQRQSRCRLIGKSLAEKYLNQYDTSLLEAELSKHSSQDKDSIREAAVNGLIERIDLKYAPALDRISQGILALTNTTAATTTLGKIKGLFQEYTEAENRERQDIEKVGREMLHQLRISGSAISQINIRAKEEWQKKLSQLVHPFEERLEYLKQELLSNTSA